MLILSFSPIASDARVLKQIMLLRERYTVTTCGIGAFELEGVEHIRIPDGLPARKLDGRLVTLKLYRAAYWRIPAVRWSAAALRGRTFDVVLADDVEAVPVALGLKPSRGVHADLHEYTPRLHDEDPAWARRIKPFWDWVCRTYVRRAASWTTVGRGLAREYEREFGFAPGIVVNAAPFAELQPTPVQRPLRLVHSGACLPARNVMAVVDAVAQARSAVTLDLYLTPNDPRHLEEIRIRAEELDGVTLHPPVPYAELIGTLNDFDLGVHLLAPTNFNNRWALPNKLFDYVQARLGVLIGPSPEMAEVVRERGIGRVADGFTAADLARVIDSLDADDVRAFKARSEIAAHDLSAESQSAGWTDAIRRLAGGDT
ncbi:hypothetical protein OB08_10940 [Microbacterium sp. HJ5]